ncbi:DUF3107 domain-containing protein [Mycetocola reblochoni]|uniref:DUF3107 domain-containing protein n=2 Tax=Mycetocola reblochoni TaxID=331618 RepID=A0A3L6ZQC2_9MICO|nr:DUF3107 domain-containing protein [Mycetocola reblochoni]RLP70106.1 DUF3107 domain-containing protein [Mycetocola reblochoni]SJN28426.1 putative ATP-binding protein [Mycetocola reblochoni REB411]
MDIRIGITNSARELAFESQQSKKDVEETVARALGEGSSYFTLSDVKGRSFLVPTAALAYVELGGEESRRVGFVA